MPQDMRGDVLGGDAGTCGCCCRGVDPDAFRDGVDAHFPGGAAGGEHESAGGGGVLALPEPQCGDGGRLERADPFLAALAVPEHAGAGFFQGDVGPGERGDLGDPGAAGEHEEHQEVVAAAGPGRAVRAGQERVGLVPVQPGDGFLGCLARLDGQDPGDERGVLGVAHGRVAEQGVNGGEPLAEGLPGVVPRFLEHGEETADRRGVDVGEVEVGWPGAGLLADPGKQEPERVPY